MFYREIREECLLCLSKVRISAETTQQTLFVSHRLMHATLQRTYSDYEHMDLRSISLNINGYIRTLDALDFTNGLGVTAYQALLKACSISNSAFPFDVDDFEGLYKWNIQFFSSLQFSGCSSIFAFDCTPSSGSAGCPQISSMQGPANYNISLEFGTKEGLQENCQMIVICEIERNLVFDSNSNWSLKSS